MFVLPSDLCFSEFRTLSRARWRIRDLGHKVRGGCFGDAVHENADEGDFQDHGECKGKAEQYTLSVEEPPTFLLGVKWNAAEIRLKLMIIRP